jgi:hypothetical protein
VVVLTTVAYVVNVAAAVSVPAVSEAPERAATSAPAVDQGTLGELRTVALETASASSRLTVVMIAGRDATTGSHRQVQCVTRSDLVASDVLLVELKDLPDVVSSVCTFGAESD